MNILKLININTVILFFILVIALPGNSQSGYQVIYNRGSREIPDLIGNKKNPLHFFDKLVFNDSISFSYVINAQDGDQIKDDNYSERVVHHSRLFDSRTFIKYDGGIITRKNKKPTLDDEYFIVDTLNDEKWTSWDENRTLMGYNCKPALRVLGNDSTLVWYTPDLPYYFGPPGFEGFPGLVLEVYDQHFGINWFAVSIQKKNVNIHFPSTAKYITKKQYSDMRKKLGF